MPIFGPGAGCRSSGTKQSRKRCLHTGNVSPTVVLPSHMVMERVGPSARQWRYSTMRMLSWRPRSGKHSMQLGLIVPAGIFTPINCTKTRLCSMLWNYTEEASIHLVLKLLASTTFSKGDVMSRPTGEVRFNPQIARYISASCQLPQEDVNSSAKWLKEVVMGLD